MRAPTGSGRCEPAVVESPRCTLLPGCADGALPPMPWKPVTGMIGGSGCGPCGWPLPEPLPEPEPEPDGVVVGTVPLPDPLPEPEPLPLPVVVGVVPLPLPELLPVPVGVVVG